VKILGIFEEGLIHQIVVDVLSGKPTKLSSHVNDPFYGVV
jgi:hypothetical protein